MQGTVLRPAPLPNGRLLTAALVFWLAAAPLSPAAPANPGPRSELHQGQTVVLPEPVRDPLEPMNRVIWAFNKSLMIGVVKPTAKVYRFIIRPPLRRAIANFGRNITYPGRLINNLLQAKWAGARDESYRFGCNTVLGVGGFFDVATKFFDIPKSDADFGQTFGLWGWEPRCFLMLPVLGPSNERDTVGWGADTAANPLTYFSPYPFDPSNPFTYLGPYAYASYAVHYNELSDSVEPLVRFTRTEKDPYSELAYAWTYVRRTQPPDLHVDGAPDQAALETLQSVFFSFRDPGFPERAQTRSVRIPATGNELTFSLWLQPKSAPLVYIVPGLGSHRLAGAALGLAELLYQNGFSAVSVSNPFNYEFMEHASSVALPAYTPIDACDLQVAFTEIQRQLDRSFPGRVSAKALLGYSMGAFESLYIAAGGCQGGPPLIQFDRVVAINSPVRLLYGTAKLDEFFQAPLAWPAEERTERIENTFAKVAALTGSPLTPQSALPLSGIEARFLVGVAFRLILRDAIFSSQQRADQGVLRHRIQTLRRNPLFREILQYSFQDYYEKFVVPYYLSRAPGLNVPEVLAQSGDLRSYTAGLQANPKVRLIGNKNDFLMSDSDLAWLQSVFAPDRLTLFETGGHLGNLSHPELQKAVLDALAGLDRAKAP